MGTLRRGAQRRCALARLHWRLPLRRQCRASRSPRRGSTKGTGFSALQQRLRQVAGPSRVHRGLSRSRCRLPLWQGDRLSQFIDDGIRTQVQRLPAAETPGAMDRRTPLRDAVGSAILRKDEESECQWTRRPRLHPSWTEDLQRHGGIRGNLRGMPGRRRPLEGSVRWRSHPRLRQHPARPDLCQLGGVGPPLRHSAPAGRR